MKLTVILVVMACVLRPCCAQTKGWQPGSGHAQLPIWPAAIPDAQRSAEPERVLTSEEELIAGKPVVAVLNVTQPTITVYPPTGTNTGAAIIVFPGGGYQELAIDL